MAREIFNRWHVIAELRDQIADEGGIRSWARKHGVTAGHVSRVLSGEKEPGEAILKPLGFKADTIYRAR